MTNGPPQTGPQASPTGGQATLSKELSDFLLELSIGVHRYAMYPPGHPSLAPAVENLFRRLAPLVDRQGSLSIGVARRQLLLGGMATEERHPVLSELARRLHDLQLGAVTFESGVTGDEVVELLATLAREYDPEETPLGMLPPEEMPSWPHIQVHAVGYDRLAIRDGEGDVVQQQRASQLWLGLARAALARDAEEIDPEQVHPRVLAERINGHKRESAYDQVIVGYMLQLANELKSERGAEAERVRRRMASLVREMSETTLARLVELGGDLESRKRLVLDANQSLAVDAVVKILDAAANASGQSVSTSMTRMLSKLAGHAESGPARLRTQASSALRDNVERLLDGWTLEDPNPDQYTRILDHISRAAPIFQSRSHRAEMETDDGTELPGPMRLVQTALEVDAWGPTVEAAVLDLISLGYSGDLIELLEGASGENEVASRTLQYVTAPSQVKRLLGRSDVDERALDTISDRLDSDAVPLFLDALADSESRAVRRKIFDRVREMGDEVGRAVLRRLETEERWYVLRNWLALLQHFPHLTLELDVLAYLQHGDARVRREALPLALGRTELRARALAMSMADPDERNLRMALTSLEAPVPETLIPSLLKRVVRAPERPDTLRAMGIRLLSGAKSPLVRDALVDASGIRRSLLGKARLSNPGPVGLAALEVLARDWRGDPAADEILARAARSDDPAVGAALEGRTAHGDVTSPESHPQAHRDRA